MRLTVASHVVAGTQLFQSLLVPPSEVGSRALEKPYLTVHCLHLLNGLTTQSETLEFPFCFSVQIYGGRDCRPSSQTALIQDTCLSAQTLGSPVLLSVRDYEKEKTALKILRHLPKASIQSDTPLPYFFMRQCFLLALLSIKILLGFHLCPGFLFLY